LYFFNNRGGKELFIPLMVLFYIKVKLKKKTFSLLLQRRGLFFLCFLTAGRSGKPNK